MTPLRLTVLALLLYAVSFFCAVYMGEIEGPKEPTRFCIRGGDAFLDCAKSLIDFRPSEWSSWAYSSAWITNPMFIAAAATAILCFRKLSMLLALSAIVHALPILTVLIPNGPGYYLWLAAPLTLLIGQAFLVKSPRGY